MLALGPSLAEYIADKSFEFREWSQWMFTVVSHDIQKAFFIPVMDCQKNLVYKDGGKLTYREYPLPTPQGVPIECLDTRVARNPRQSQLQLTLVSRRDERHGL